MQIATWNVNSIRARWPRFLPWLELHRPDVVCLQELKCQDEQFPREEVENAGYNVAVFGQKTYNGVAILSKRPIDDVWRGLETNDAGPEARVLGATIGDLQVLNVYVVNGQAVGTPKYAYKLAWFARLEEFARERLDLGGRCVVLGDFNVTFDDRDVYDPDAWREKILCSTPEREALARITGLGLHDAFRRFHEDGGHYTWWDFKTGGFRRNHGLRIDHLLMSEPLLAECTDVTVDREARAGEKPSDHAPVLASFR